MAEKLPPLNTLSTFIFLGGGGEEPTPVELQHICGPALSMEAGYFPAIDDTMYFDPKRGIWYGSDIDGINTIIMRFCFNCGKRLRDLEAVNDG